MAKHTPGPWIIQREKSFHYSIRTNYVHDRGHDVNVVREVRCEANAQLMATAPELLEQLEALVVQIEHAGLIVPPNVLKVISKAKGVSRG